MSYAFRSGYLAARSIIENRDYDKMWKKEFLKQIRISERNRKVYELLSNKRLEKMVGPFAERLGSDLRVLLKNIYNRPALRLLNAV